MATKVQPIGRTVSLTIPAADVTNIPAKVDTGAYSSSIWASNIQEKDGLLSFSLMGPKSEYYTGKRLSTDDYKRVIIHNSFGESERRYVVRLSVVINGRRVRSSFTLANRSLKTYPALIGRRLLIKRFVVDVGRSGPIVSSNWR